MKLNPHIQTQQDFDFDTDAPPWHADSVSFIALSGKKPNSPEPKKKAPRACGLCPGCHGSLIDNKCPDCNLTGVH